MKDELSDFLVKTYPNLYKKNMYFECQDGWFNLIEDLSEQLESIISKMEEKDRPYAVQVKEKFGGLRFYMNDLTSEIDELITKWEVLSYFVCEQCGDKGERLSINHWITTLCQKCAQKK